MLKGLGCFACRATIPLLDADSYRRPWFLTAMALSPTALFWYLGLRGPVPLAASLLGG